MFVRHQVVLEDKSKYVKIELYLLSSTIHYVKKTGRPKLQACRAVSIDEISPGRSRQQT